MTQSHIKKNKQRQSNNITFVRTDIHTYRGLDEKDERLYIAINCECMCARHIILIILQIGIIIINNRR